MTLHDNGAPSRPKPTQAVARQLLRWARGLSLALGLCASAWSTTSAPALQAGEVEIRRTTDGIPHIRAGTWRHLGRGIGHVQASDALCTLAEAFVTYEGRRAWFFGPDAKPARDATFGRVRNLDLDFFFRAFADADMLAQYRSQQPAELIELVDGYAAGYNRALHALRRERTEPRRSCAQAPWVREISADDVLRRLYAAQIAAGYVHFIPQIVQAQPPGVAARQGADDVSRRDAAEALKATLSPRVGEQTGLGSNAMAFGRAFTGRDESVLFGNPHWYWGGPDRLYQMHLVIPGQLDVAGAAFLGVPLIMIGFNAHVAWTHTVSLARRFGLFDLTLDPADPTAVRVAGRTQTMQSREVVVELRGQGGTPRRVARTLYRSAFGPVLDFGAQEPAFGWTRGHAFAIRDVNAQNFRVFRNFLAWNRARSLDEFIAIQRREAATPWVNTVAIGRGDPRVWYADLGAVPHVPDDLRADCTTARGRAFAQLDASVPVLDASRPACEWRHDARAVQPGAMPADAMPALLSEDYVANMNDSHWLANPRQRLEGFPAVMGGEREALSLRGRHGHGLAEALRGVSPATLPQRLMQAVLVPQAPSATLFKDELLAQACRAPSVELPATPAAEGRRAGPAQTVSIAAACDVLQRWSGRADTADRGARLWDAFWAELGPIPEAAYRVPFSADDPLHTPRGLDASRLDAARALGRTVRALRARGEPLAAPLGARRYLRGGGHRVGLYGGCNVVGYFAVACDEAGRERLGPDSMGNSYLQVVSFGPQGPQAHTLLAHGQDEDALTRGTGFAPVQRYARKDWLRFPFREEDIARDPGLSRTVLRP